MRKYLVLLAAAAVATALMLAFSGSASASNACPPSSQNPGGTPPNCGHPAPAPPAGNCESADAVLLTDDAKIVCLYGPGKGSLATKDEECPDALIATGPDPILGGGLCVFLPPAST